MVSLIQTGYECKDLFSDSVRMVESHEGIDRPMPREVMNPVMWREVLHIPGDKEWEDKPYAKHERIELQPMADVLVAGVTPKTPTRRRKE